MNAVPLFAVLEHGLARPRGALPAGTLERLRTLFCPVLGCPVLGCPVLGCPVLGCPVLAVWGERDRFVPARKSAAWLKACLSEAKTRDVTIEVVPGANHGLAAETHQELHRDGYPAVMARWLEQLLRKR